MNGAERVYRILLLAYPLSFRREFEHEMVLFFRDQRREGAVRGAAYWLALCADTIRSAPREWHARFTEISLIGGLFMKTMAVLAMMIGAFQGFNGMREATAINFSGRPGLEQAGLTLAILSSLFLIVAGAALLRRGRDAAGLARAAAIATICSFVFMGATSPVLSIFAMLLGTVFPAAMLVYLFINRSAGPARPLVS